MASMCPSSIAQLLLGISLSVFLLANAHPMVPPSPPRQTAAAPTSAAKGVTGISSGIVSTLRETLGVIKNVASIISSFPIGGILGGGDLRLSSAIADCLDLLDMSSDELSWSMSTTSSSDQPANAGGGAAAARLGTGDARSDLRSWLGGALGNQDTCKEGLDETGSLLGSLVATGLQSVTTLLTDGLGQVAAGEAVIATSSCAARTDAARGRGLAEGGAPHWLRARDRRLLQMPVGPGGLPVDAVVAKDGSGNYTTVSAAVDAAPSESASRYVIYVKKGVYKETVDIKKKKWNLVLVGDGMNVTVISGHRNYVDGYTTFRSATVAVNGKGFMARDLTFENTAGPSKHQAVALRCNSDLSVFYRCGFEGYQDTLYAHSLRQFYRDCRISGTSYISAEVRPEGWLAWDGQFALDTLYYGEYMNTGPGAGVSDRVKWPGFHVMTNPSQAGNFTVAQFIEGSMWLPATGVKYTARLTS
ncbi:hypothetical protein ABZP36_026739 [Zizania latifolia]